MTLIEQFIQEEYENFLEQEETRQILEIYKNHKAILEAFDAYYQLVELQEEYKGVTEEVLQEGTLSDSLANLINKVSSSFQTAAPILAVQSSAALPNGTLQNGTSVIDPKTGKLNFVAEPAKKTFSYKKIDSVVGFINGIIAWVKNVLINVINFTTKGIRNMLGLAPVDEDAYKKEKRSTDPFSLIAKAKKVAAIERQYGFGTLKLSDGENAGKIDDKAKALDKKIDGYISTVDAKDLITSMNEASIFGALHTLTAQKNPALYFKGADKDDKTYKEFVNVDLSKDLSQLKMLLIKFFDLYDDAIGTNGEKLFDTSDLEMLFKSLNRIFNNIEDGNLSDYDYYGKLLDAGSIKQSYEVTAQNIKNLTDVFNQVEATIKQLLLNINIKSGIAATYDSNKFILLSSLTFKQLSEIAKLVMTKIDEVNVMQAKLEMLGRKYEKLVKELDKVKQSWISVGAGISVQTEFERAVKDLYDAAKFSFQTLMLRFTALVNYNSILKDSYMVIQKLSKVNEVVVKKLDTK